MITATCTGCGFTGSIAALAVHSCYVQEMGGRCEDYPCCGHTDGDGCQTRPEHTSDYWQNNPHCMCDHAAGVCDLDWEDDYDDTDYAESGAEAARRERDSEFGF